MNDQHLKEIEQLNKELETAYTQMQTQTLKINDLDQKVHELTSQAAVSTETISTLQKDLFVANLCAEKLRSVYDKLGLNSSDISETEHSLENVVQKICGNNEVVQIVKDVLKKDKGLIDNEEVNKQTEQVVSSVSAEWKQKCEQLYNEIESLQKQNARLQVDISTVTSQVNSLTAQYTALQLANSQLVAEKEEVSFCFFKSVKVVLIRRESSKS